MQVFIAFFFLFFFGGGGGGGRGTTCPVPRPICFSSGSIRVTFALDTSPKQIDCEGLGESRTGTSQGNSQGNNNAEVNTGSLTLWSKVSSNQKSEIEHFHSTIRIVCGRVANQDRHDFGCNSHKKFWPPLLNQAIAFCTDLYVLSVKNDKLALYHNWREFIFLHLLWIAFQTL